MTTTPLLTRIAVHAQLLDDKPDYDSIADVVADAVSSLPDTKIVRKDDEPNITIEHTGASKKVVIGFSVEGDTSKTRVTIASTIRHALENPESGVKVKVLMTKIV